MYSDSQYCIKIAQKIWHAKDNLDLVHRLWKLMENRTIRWIKVKGHSGDPGNDAADALATEAIKENPRRDDRVGARLGRDSCSGLLLARFRLGLVPLPILPQLVQFWYFQIGLSQIRLFPIELGVVPFQRVALLTKVLRALLGFLRRGHMRETAARRLGRHSRDRRRRNGGDPLDHLADPGNRHDP